MSNKPANIYKKKINWMVMGNMIAIITIMAVLMLLPSDSYLGTIISMTFICVFSLMTCITLLGVFSYQLTILEDCIIEKSFFKKKTVHKWEDFQSITISLDHNSIELYGNHNSITLKEIDHFDELLSCLCEKVGYDHLVIRKQQ